MWNAPSALRVLGAQDSAAEGVLDREMRRERAELPAGMFEILFGCGWLTRGLCGLEDVGLFVWAHFV